MRDDDDIDLKALVVAPPPQVVGRAMRRFRRRVMRWAAMATVATLGLVVAVLVLWPVQGDIDRLKGVTGWEPPGGWDSDAVTVFAKGELPRDASWKAYAWSSRKGMVCWAVLVEHRRPVDGCLPGNPLRPKPFGFPGNALLTTTETGGRDPFIPQTVLAGVVPAEVASVHAALHGPDGFIRGQNIATHPAEGSPVRFFAIVLAGDVTTVSRVSIKAHDSKGEAVTRPNVDIRSVREVAPEERRAATVAVAAGGDAAAVPTSVSGPQPYNEALAAISNVQSVAADGQGRVYVVTLAGRFPGSPDGVSPGRALLEGPTGVRLVLVSADLGTAVAIVDPGRIEPGG